MKKVFYSQTPEGEGQVNLVTSPIWKVKKDNSRMTCFWITTSHPISYLKFELHSCDILSCFYLCQLLNVGIQVSSWHFGISTSHCLQQCINCGKRLWFLSKLNRLSIRPSISPRGVSIPQNWNRGNNPKAHQLITVKTKCDISQQ